MFLFLSLIENILFCSCAFRYPLFTNSVISFSVSPISVSDLAAAFGAPDSRYVAQLIKIFE